jgi:hypothetical protein
MVTRADKLREECQIKYGDFRIEHVGDETFAKGLSP